jgi:hypothetical protein
VVDRASVHVPGTLEEALSPEWLTGALASRFPGIRVTSVTPGPVISRVSTNARFTIECADGVPDGLSPQLCIKGYFSDTGRLLMQAGEPEVYFYRDLAARTGVRTLRCVFAGIDATTRHGVVITEDVVPLGARFLDARSEYSPGQVAESLDVLATLHAATWADPACATTGWLAPRMESVLKARGVPEIRYNFDGPIGAGVPDEVRDAERLAGAYRSLAVVMTSVSPWAVLHGDAHVGNVFLDDGGRPSFLDWQLVQRGAWYVDVGYHIASALTVPDRRAAEGDLLRHYLDRLSRAGVEAPAWDEAWQGMRRGVVYGFFLWGITLKVDPAVTSVLLHRLGTAAADHDAFAAVG